MVHDVNAYKFDSRSKEEFIRDLEKGLQNEVTVIRNFRDILNNSRIESPEVVYVGSDEEGKVQYESRGEVANVDLFPDYLLKYKNHNRRLRFNFIEVKVCNPHSKLAYFKVNQLEQFREIGSVLILFVMGVATKSPRFILVTPEDILSLGIEPEEVYGKGTIKAHVGLFNWENFEPYPRKYNILDKEYIRGR